MEVCLKKLDRSPSIVESCRPYKPPFDARKATHRLLRHTPRKFLSELHSVVLTNFCGALQRGAAPKNPGDVAVFHSVRYRAITARSGEASLRTSPPFWTIWKNQWPGNGFELGFFEIWKYLKSSFTNWAPHPSRAPAGVQGTRRPCGQMAQKSSHECLSGTVIGTCFPKRFPPVFGIERDLLKSLSHAENLIFNSGSCI